MSQLFFSFNWNLSAPKIRIPLVKKRSEFSHKATLIVKFVGKPELLAETFRPFFLPAKFPIDVLDKSVYYVDFSRNLRADTKKSETHISLDTQLPHHQICDS